MKYGICSDLHMGHYNEAEQRIVVDKINACGADLMLIAGDIDEDPVLVKTILGYLDVPYLYIAGNHDYYWGGLTSDTKETKEHNVVAATLWTNFWGNPLYGVAAQQGIPDFTHIKVGDRMINPMDMEEMFKEHLEFIEKSECEIVMTHFPPSAKSHNPKFGIDPLTPYFTNDISEYRLDAMKKKLWVHGHVHNQFDYMIGDMRVVCNPLGYPFERNPFLSVTDYEIKIIEM